MAFPIIEAISAISGLLGRIIPDKTQVQRDQIAKEILELTHQFDLDKAQISVNNTEAQHPTVFVAGWRPFTGWVCACTLALGAVVKVFLPAVIIIASPYNDVSILKDTVSQLNAIDMGFFLTILGGLLGLGTLRTFEKKVGVARK